MDGLIEMVIGSILIAHSMGILGKRLRKRASAEDMAGWHRFLFPFGVFITVIGLIRFLT